MKPTPVERPQPGAPEWLESTLNITPGRDPLGFQTITVDRIIPRLVPGVLALSRRARYFSFFAFLLEEYRRRQLPASNNALSPFIKVREYDLALAVELCPRNHSNEVTASNGRQRAGPAAARTQGEFARRESVDSYLGGYGLYYRTPMIEVGLVAPRGTALAESGTPTPLDLLWPTNPIGQTLASTFKAKIETTEYFTKYFASDRDVPREVLVEYGSIACLCRLDESPAEQLALRSALLERTPSQPPHDVGRRREAFAFLIWLSAHDQRVVRYDEAFRHRIWKVHEDQETGGTQALQFTGARWAALIAKEFMQEGISSLWAAVCRTGLAAGHDGIKADELDTRLVDPLVAPSSLNPLGKELLVAPGMRTTDLRDGVADVAAGESLEELRAWAAREATAYAGLALMLAVDARMAALGDQSAGWHEIASQNGERQPGLTVLRARLAEHLRGDPTVRDTVSWMVRTLVIWPHELIAYSKLPDSTFRFRWESGRLRFYDLSPERFRLTDIRRDALGRVAADIGLLTWTDEGAVPTKAGMDLVDEVFG